MAFPNAKAFRAAFKDVKQNRPKKNYLVKLTARYLLSLLKANDSLARDKVRSNFFANLRQYGDRVTALAKKPRSLPPDFSQPISEQAMKLLITIQNNSLINAKNALAAKAKESEKILTLRDYSSRTQFDTLKFVPKTLEKVAKTIQSAGERRSIDLVANPMEIPCQLNCFKCSSSGVVPAEVAPEPTSMSPSPPPPSDYPFALPTPLSFVDPALEKANVWRIIPLQTVRDVETHELNFHTLHDASKLTSVNKHRFTFFCKHCSREEIEWSLMCCR